MCSLWWLKCFSFITTINWRRSGNQLSVISLGTLINLTLALPSLPTVNYQQIPLKLYSSWDMLFGIISTFLWEKAMAPHSSTLAWKIPWMEEPRGLQSMESQRVGHDWATSFSFHFLFTPQSLSQKWGHHTPKPWVWSNFSLLSFQSLLLCLGEPGLGRTLPLPKFL